MRADTEAVECGDGGFAHQRLRIGEQRRAELGGVAIGIAPVGELAERQQNAGAHLPIEVGEMLHERCDQAVVVLFAEGAGGGGAREAIGMFEQRQERPLVAAVGVGRHGAGDAPRRCRSPLAQVADVGEIRACRSGVQSRQSPRRDAFEQRRPRIRSGLCQHSGRQALRQDVGDFRAALLAERVDERRVARHRLAVVTTCTSSCCSVCRSASLRPCSWPSAQPACAATVLSRSFTSGRSQAAPCTILMRPSATIASRRTRASGWRRSCSSSPPPKLRAALEADDALADGERRVGAGCRAAPRITARAHSRRRLDWRRRGSSACVVAADRTASRSSEGNSTGEHRRQVRGRDKRAARTGKSWGLGSVQQGRRIVRQYVVAVVGATGAVGSEMLRVLEQRDSRCASCEPSHRRSRPDARSRLSRCRSPCAPSSRIASQGVDIALFSAGADRSRAFAPDAVRAGALVIDNSSAFRMQADVPLVVPEVNPDAARAHRGLIANPNCSTIQMVVALRPVRDLFGLRRIIVSTYQSVSGTGARAMRELEAGTRAHLAGEKETHTTSIRTRSHSSACRKSTSSSATAIPAKRSRCATRPARSWVCQACRSSPPACGCRSSAHSESVFAETDDR